MANVKIPDALAEKVQLIWTKKEGSSYGALVGATSQALKMWIEQNKEFLYLSLDDFKEEESK